MLKENNSDVAVCCANLLKTLTREVPYARDKGLDSSLIDDNGADIVFDLTTAAYDAIEAYEDRVNVDNILIDLDVDANGNFNYTLSISDSEEEEDED